MEDNYKDDSDRSDITLSSCEEWSGSDLSDDEYIPSGSGDDEDEEEEYLDSQVDNILYGDLDAFVSLIHRDLENCKDPDHRLMFQKALMKVTKLFRTYN